MFVCVKLVPAHMLKQQRKLHFWIEKENRKTPPLNPIQSQSAVFVHAKSVVSKMSIRFMSSGSFFWPFISTYLTYLIQPQKKKGRIGRMRFFFKL